eukprot:gene3753-4011_t
MKAILVLKHNIIPEQPFETEFGQITGLSLDQTRFAFAFIGALLSGILIRWLRHPTARNFFSFTVGLLLVYYPFGSGVIHGVITSIATYLVMWLVPRKCGTLTWLICFPYLSLLHVANASGISWNEGVLDFTGGQMVLTLKLISMAMCFQDANSKEPDDLTSYQKAHVFKRLPSFLEFFGFVFAFGNLLAGPVIEFRDYQQWVKREGLWDPKAARKIPWTGDYWAGIKAFWVAMCSMVFFLYMEKGWSFKLLATPWYRQQNLFMRLVTMQVIGTTYRNRYYFAWSLGHSSLAFAGLDFLKWGPDGRGVWGRCRNAQPLKVEFCDSSRLLAGYWNTTTGIFLRRYVYERLTPPGRKPTFMTLMVTQLVSGVWHGLYPGYILFFAGSAVFFAHSTVIYNWEKALMPLWLANSFPWWAFKVFCTKQGLDFLAMAFLWLTWKECMLVVTGDLLHLGEGIKSALVDGSGSRPDLVGNGAQRQE